MVCMGDAFSVPFILSCFLSVPSLVAWLIFIVNILGIITDQFCWIWLLFSLILQIYRYGYRYRTTFSGGRGAIIRGRRLIEGRLSYEEMVFIRLTVLGAYWILGPWEWALIRGWALIKFSPFSASLVCLFCNKTRITNLWKNATKTIFD